MTPSRKKAAAPPSAVASGCRRDPVDAGSVCSPGEDSMARRTEKRDERVAVQQHGAAPDAKQHLTVAPGHLGKEGGEASPAESGDLTEVDDVDGGASARHE